MPRSLLLSLVAALATLALGGCGPDPCSAARQWASTCGLDSLVDEADFRQQCEQAMTPCTDSQKAEAASFYQCLSSQKICSSSGMQSCAQNVTLGAASCINNFD